MNKQSRPQIRYSEEFKRMVVEDIESGVMNVAQACRYYGISTPVSVYKWLELYGLRKNKGQKVLVMSYKEENELVRLRRELALLKKELEEAELRAIAWKSMVDEIEQDLGYPVKKALESSLARCREAVISGGKRVSIGRLCRIYGILKQEFGLGSLLPNLETTRKLLNNGIKIYNNERLHASLGYKTPDYVYNMAQEISDFPAKNFTPKTVNL